MDLRFSIVRILDPDGDTAGTGFVVTEDGLIATCAHVVDDAGMGPGDTVSLVFLADEERKATVKPEYWTDRDAQDVAILELEDSLPDRAEPLLLGSSSGSENHPFHTFGFPEQKSEEGTPGGGIFLQWTTENGFDVLTLRSPEVARGFSGAPALDDAKRRVVGMVVSIAELDKSGRGGETGWAIPSETLEAVCSTLRSQDIAPYRGLDAFTEDDAEFFFGRQRVVESLLGILRDEPPLLAVLGPSGSGKSSLVQAGIVSQLRQGKVPGSARWEVIVNRHYDDDPFESLTRQGLEGAEKGLVGAAKAWLDRHSDKTRLVLVMDQFEQLLVDRPLPRRQEFLEQLTQLLREPMGVTVVLVMRDDFFSRLAQQAHALVNEALQSGLAYHIPGELHRDELIAIVREPAEAVGLRFESGLIETIVDDALETATASEAGKPVAHTTILPLLEFALTQLWEEDHKGGELTHETYNRIGGVTGSLGRWANRAYRSLGAELQPIARRILTDLVYLGSRSEGIPDSRRIRSFDDLCRNTDERQMVQQVVRKLTDARLLVTAGEASGGQSSVQMIHDALLREWDRLRHWLEEDRRFLLWHQEMGRRTRAWVRTAPNNPNQRDEGSLLRGRELAEAEGWLREHGENLGEAERKFIKASRRARTKFQERVLGLGALFVIVVMVLGAVSFWQRGVARSNEEQAQANAKEARMQASIALTRQLLARSSGLQESQPDASLLVNVEALQRAPATIKEEARFDLLAKLTQPYHVATQLAGHDSNVTDVAFSPDGKLLASSSDDMTVRLWDVQSGKQHGKPLEGHDNWVLDVAFSPDGNLLATASWDGTVRLWDVQSGKQHGEPLSSHNEAVYGVAFSPDGNLLASAVEDGENGTVRLWDVQSGKPYGKPLEGHEERVFDVAFSPEDGKLLASAGEDGTVRLWDVESGEPHDEPLIGHTDRVTGVAFSKDGDLLASSSDDMTVRLWDVESGEPHDEPLSGHTGQVTGVTFSPEDGNLLASASADQTARLWDVDSKQLRGERKTLEGHNDRVWGVTFSPEDGNLLASAGEDGTVRLWDVASGKRHGVPLDNHKDKVEGVAFSKDGDLLASASEDGTVRLWNVQSGTPHGEPLEGHDGEVRAVAFSPNGKLLASAGGDGTVRLWDVQSGTPHGEPLEGHDDEVRGVAFSPEDGNLLASASEDRTVCLWNVESDKPHCQALEGHKDWVWGVTFSKDGDLLASSSDDTTVRLWDVESGAPRGKPLSGHGGEVRGVAFSPDGELLASASEDQTVRLWDAANKETRGQPFEGHVNSVNDVAFNPDGDLLASASVDETVRLWDIQVESLMTDACIIANRDLSRDEWRRFVGPESEFEYERTCSNLPAG